MTTGFVNLGKRKRPHAIKSTFGSFCAFKETCCKLFDVLRLVVTRITSNPFTSNTL